VVRDWPKLARAFARRYPLFAVEFHFSFPVNDLLAFQRRLNGDFLVIPAVGLRLFKNPLNGPIQDPDNIEVFEA
jgi:hypothetical protein